MVNNKLIVGALYPTVEKALSKKDNVSKLKKAIERYIDINHEKLTTLGPVDRTIFSEYDMNVLYDIVGLSANEIRKVLKDSGAIKPEWKVANNPFNAISILSIRYFKITKNKPMSNLVMTYLTLSMYPSIHWKYFKYGANEKVMNYTINELSNKYKIKQLGVFYLALIDTANGADLNHTDRLIRGEDKDIVNYINDIKTRINMLMRKISNEYYKNKDAELYLNIEQESVEEDNYREAESNIYGVERLSNGVVLKLIVNGPNMNLVKASAKICKVSVSELRNYVTTMVTGDNKEDIKKIIESILFLYLFDSKNRLQEINSDKFFIYGIEIYRKSNTSDKNIIRIKSILDSWLEELGAYKKTNRLNTINDFRRALFIFFLFTIQYTNNN